MAGEQVNDADPSAALALYRCHILPLRAAGNVLAMRYLRYMGVQAYEEFGRYRECLELATELVADTDAAAEPLWRAVGLALAQAGVPAQRLERARARVARRGRRAAGAPPAPGAGPGAGEHGGGDGHAGLRGIRRSLGGLGAATAPQGVARGIDSGELRAGRLELAMLDLRNGELQTSTGDFDRAREHFRSAWEHATRSDAGSWQATALVALAGTEVAAHGPHPAVMVWSQLATSLLRRLGEQTRSFTAELEARRRAGRLGAQRDVMTRQVLQDPLTGLASRRALERALEQAAAAGEPVGACFVDVDHVKQVNDSYSHAVGDEVLRTVGELTAAACRTTTNLIARYGGDAFVVLTTGDTPTGPLAERIRSSVGEHLWQRLAAGLRVTVSVRRACSLPAAAVLAHADTAPRDAKRAGRNRVAATA